LSLSISEILRMFTYLRILEMFQVYALKPEAIIRPNGPPNGPVLFARWRLSSVTLPVCGPADRRARGSVGGRAADIARRASTVTSR